VEGARLSTVEEELPTISYETGQASEPADEPCKRVSQSQIDICNQGTTKHKISRKKGAIVEGILTAGSIQKSATNTK
jgi:hypothetical protein